MGTWRKAIDAFQHALELRPDDPLFGELLGMAYLGGGDSTSFKGQAALMVKRFGESQEPATLDAICSCCATISDRGVDNDILVAMARRAVRLKPTEWALETLGVLQFRAGNFDLANASLDKAAGLRHEWEITDFTYSMLAIKAMAYHHLPWTPQDAAGVITAALPSGPCALSTVVQTATIRFRPRLLLDQAIRLAEGGDQLEWLARVRWRYLKAEAEAELMKSRP